MGQYTVTTFGEAIGTLANRLGDPTNQWWTQAELQFYIKEALQTWQAHSQFYSIKAGFQTNANAFFYNLFTLIPQLAPTITDQQLIQQIQMHLQEPINASVWLGTPQFNYNELVSFIQKRRDQFFMESGLVMNQDNIRVTPPNGEIQLDDTVIDVRRAMWRDISNNNTVNILWKADEFTFNGGNPGWFNTLGLPTDYSVVLEQPLSVQLSPAPLNFGRLLLLSTNSGPILTPATSPTILGVPDDFVWVIKFGVLADLLSQAGPGNDSYRADYFESRWHDGIELARITNFAKLGFQNGLPAFLDSMEDLDATNPSWVSDTPGAPNGLGTMGNFVSTVPIADGAYSLLFDITPKMILPSQTSDYLQVGQEFLGIILDYAQHLAQLKEGMAEISQTLTLYKNFMSVAAVENDRLRANAQNFDILSDRTQIDAHMRLRRISDLDLEALDYGQQQTSQSK